MQSHDTTNPARRTTSDPCWPLACECDVIGAHDTGDCDADHVDIATQGGTLWLWRECDRLSRYTTLDAYNVYLAVNAMLDGTTHDKRSLTRAVYQWVQSHKHSLPAAPLSLDLALAEDGEEALDAWLSDEDNRLEDILVKLSAKSILANVSPQVQRALVLRASDATTVADDRARLQGFRASKAGQQLHAMLSDTPTVTQSSSSYRKGGETRMTADELRRRGVTGTHTPEIAPDGSII